MRPDGPQVAQARREAERARANLWASVDAIIAHAHDLQDRLAPGHLARDAWEAAKSKGADIAEDAVDAVRKRPVAASGAIAALALFIAREPLMELAGKMMNGKSKTRSKSRSAARPNTSVEKSR